MKLFNAAVVIAAALPYSSSAVQIGAPTNYEERKLQDEVGSMPFDAMEAVDAMGPMGLGLGAWDIFDKIDDLKCEVAAELIDELEGFLDDSCVLPTPPTTPAPTPRPTPRTMRSLGEVEDVPHHHLLEVAEREQGDLAGVVASKDGMLPDSVADSLCAHLEGLYDAEEFPPVNSLPKTGRNIARNDVYTVKIDGPELISMIGKDNTRGLLDYFHQSLGHEVPVTGILLQVAKNGDVGQSFAHHKDEMSTLLVFLNDMDAGGELDYLTNEGHLEIPAKKGRAVVHGPNTIHGAKMWYGDRSVFYFMSSGSHFDDCMLKDLLD